jgi:pimeloyl-ACP methyl ester carboxylesterase
VDPRVAVAFTRHLGDRARVAEMLATARRLVPEIRNPFELEKISCPVMLVWGTNDALVFPTGAERVLEIVPESTLVTFERCGHCPQIEEADRLVDLLVEFPHQLAQAA